MPIKILRQGLPILGYAKIGFPNPKTPEGKLRAPTKLDHWELTTVQRDSDGRLIPDVELMSKLVIAGAPTCGGCERSKQLQEVCAMDEFANGLPTALHVGLPFDDPEAVFPNRLAYYRGRTVFCSGDGETAMRATVRREKKDGKDLDIFGPAEPYGPCGSECADFEARRCKPAARLRFVLRDQQSVGGVYEYRTTSWNSIGNLQAGLDMIRAMTGGTLAWLPLVFAIAPQTVQPKGGGAANTAYIARLYYDGPPEQLLAAVRDRLAIRAPMMQEIRQLEASISGDWEMSPEEVEEFRHEFDHENAERDRAAGVVVELDAGAAGGVDETEPASSGPAGGAEMAASGSAEEVHDLASEPAAPAAEEPTASPSSSPEVATGSADADAPPPKPLSTAPHLMVDQEQRQEIWSCVKTRALEIQCDPIPLLAAVLKRLQVSATTEIRKKDFGRAMNYAMNAKKPA